MSFPIQMTLRRTLALLILGFISACTGPVPPPSVELQAHARPMVAETTSNLGYRVTLEEARIAISGVYFVIEGEAHASLFDSLESLFVSRAYAHPGHVIGGTVTGELSKDIIIDLLSGSNLGTATLLEGAYTSANVIFGQAEGIPENDLLAGRTAVFRGRAERDGVTTPFEVIVEVPEGFEMEGVNAYGDVSELGPIRSIALTFSLKYGAIGFFDDVDFSSLAAMPSGHCRIASGHNDPTYFELRRRLQTPGFYEFSFDE